jgi:hypothetical protein
LFLRVPNGDFLELVKVNPLCLAFSKHFGPKDGLADEERLVPKDDAPWDGARLAVGCLVAQLQDRESLLPLLLFGAWEQGGMMLSAMHKGPVSEILARQAAHGHVSW